MMSAPKKKRSSAYLDDRGFSDDEPETDSDDETNSGLIELSRGENYRVLEKVLPEPIKDGDIGNISHEKIKDMENGSLIVEKIPRAPDGGGLFYDSAYLNYWFTVNDTDPSTRQIIPKDDRDFLRSITSISKKYLDKTENCDKPETYSQLILHLEFFQFPTGNPKSYKHIQLIIPEYEQEKFKKVKNLQTFEGDIDFFVMGLGKFTFYKDDMGWNSRKPVPDNIFDGAGPIGFFFENFSVAATIDYENSQWIVSEYGGMRKIKMKALVNK